MAVSRRVVSVFGSNDPCEGDAAYEQACQAGEQLARLGYDIANGGYGGTMEASARGAKAAGGSAIGVTCSVWKSAPNACLDRVIQTASLAERVEKLIELGEGGYLVLPGATGTLAELAWVWELTCKKFLPRRPIVCLGEFWRPLVEMMVSQRPAAGGTIAVIDDPRQLREHFPYDV